MSKYKIQTFTGKLVDYLEPDPETICIEDIAKALSQECRFGGQSKFHYSVAQHSVLACGLAPHNWKLEALLHDAEEAYIKDVPSPLVAAISRGMVSQYECIKLRIKAAIRTKFNLSFDKEAYKQIIKPIDLRLAATERDALFKNPQPLFAGENIEPYNIVISPWLLIDANKKFLEMYELYRRDKANV